MNVICEGQLQGAIQGFHNRDTLFEFTNGQIWRQAEYKYLYQYLYMPNAKIIDGPEGVLIQIEGIEDSVRVLRVR